MIRLIGADLDGTFLRNDKSISRYSEDVVRRFAASGGWFVPVTGRPLEGLPPALHPLIEEGCIRYAVTSNGAHMYALDGLERDGSGGAARLRATLLYSREMTRERTERVIDTCRSFLPPEVREGTILEVFSGGRGYHGPKAESLLMRRFEGTPVADYLRMSRTIVEDLDAFLREQERGYENISVMLPDAGLGGALAAKLSEDPHTRVIRSLATDLEIVSAGADKGAAFLELARLLEVPVSGTLALGDGDNDRGLLSAAGTAVVMQGADPALFRDADYRAGSNEEDGAARAIEALTGMI